MGKGVPRFDQIPKGVSILVEALECVFTFGHNEI